VTSPIDGRISRQLVNIGNLVQADTTQLTTVVSVDPIYAYFSMDELAALKYQRVIKEGKNRGGSRGCPATFAADPHDLFCLYSWRIAVSACQRRRGRNGPGFGNRGFRRNDRGDFFRHFSNPGVFLGDRENFYPEVKEKRTRHHRASSRERGFSSLNPSEHHRSTYPTSRRRVAKRGLTAIVRTMRSLTLPLVRGLRLSRAPLLQ
jgi:hypothetical protein